MENKPGNGYDSPFGNGNGATSMGASNGAHNFLEDPASAAPKSGGRDFTTESRDLPSGQAPDLDKASIPDGGLLPFGGGDKWAKDPDCSTDGGVEPKSMPFKNLK